MSLYNKIIDLQKLDQAWERVRKNKPAAGVDNVTYDEFDSNRKEELKLLQQELKNHAYETLPVKLVNLYKGEKVRTIALYSMRDKAVQQSIAAELNKIFDNRFSERTFAYRNNKSALNAISDIERVISEGKYRDFLKVDITHYFDTIRWDILENVLRDYIGEDDVIELIRLNSCSKSLDEATGELVDKRSGIYQGSSIAPVLSNVYLMEFDLWLSEETDVFFVRYSDDLLLLGSTHEEMIAYLTQIKTRLEAIGLSINTSKSVVGVIADGFDFLGYHFDTLGKSIPSKAEDNLYERLEMMWLTSGNISIEEKLKKVIEIIGGWEQYFRGERNVGSVFEYAALAYTKGNAGDQIKWLIAQRCAVDNIYRDIAGYLAAFWNDNGCSRLELFEYEQFYHVRQTIAPETLFREELNTHENELLKAYKIFYALEDEEQATEIMQLYTDLKEYSIAEYWHGVASDLHDKSSKGYEIVLKSCIDDIVIHKNTSAKLYGAFAGREDIYAREVLDAHRGRKIETELKPLTEAVFRDHLSGKITADAYIQRPNATVRYMIIDVDLSKKILLQYERGCDVYNRYMQKVLDYTCMLKKSLMNMGITGYIEYSGNRGYHLWVFFSEWIPVRYINILSDIIDVSNERDEDIAIEYFPNKTRIKGGKYGQAIKLPYGIHVKTGERSYFLNDAG